MKEKPKFPFVGDPRKRQKRFRRPLRPANRPEKEIEKNAIVPFKANPSEAPKAPPAKHPSASCKAITDKFEKMP